MSDDEQQNQGEAALIAAYNAGRHERTSRVLGNSIVDALRQHDERLAAEAQDNDQEHDDS